MKQGSTLFLKGVVILMGLAVLAACIYIIPEAMSNERVGNYRQIIFGMVIAAIPFFFALSQAYKLLNFIDANKAFSEGSVKALKNIKYCGIIIGILYAIGLPFIFQVADKDDAPGAIVITMVIIFASIVVSVFAAVLQKLMQSGLEIKSENDLTV